MYKNIAHQPENTLFSFQKRNLAGEVSKNESKDGFSGGVSAGLPAQAAGLSFSHFAQSRFEFRRTKEPKFEQVLYLF